MCCSAGRLESAYRNILSSDLGSLALHRSIGCAARLSVEPDTESEIRESDAGGDSRGPERPAVLTATLTDAKFDGGALSAAPF